LEETFRNFRKLCPQPSGMLSTEQSKLYPQYPGNNIYEFQHITFIKKNHRNNIPMILAITPRGSGKSIYILVILETTPIESRKKHLENPKKDIQRILETIVHANETGEDIKGLMKITSKRSWK
jgi:hypothetical protein